MIYHAAWDHMLPRSVPLFLYIPVGERVRIHARTHIRTHNVCAARE